VIRRLAARGDMAIVLVEQYYDFAAELADRYLVMERGEVVLSGRGADMEVDGVRRRISI
jgi:urea transport system ATP-binding protein